MFGVNDSNSPKTHTPPWFKNDDLIIIPFFRADSRMIIPTKIIYILTIFTIVLYLIIIILH